MCLEGSTPIPGYNLQTYTFGIKLYQVCESGSGYCVGFDVHTGDEETSCTPFCNLLELDEDLGENNVHSNWFVVQCGYLKLGTMFT